MPTQETKSMVSEVSICNQALRWLGQRPIDSLDDRSEKAEWMRDNYPFIRDAVIEERMWTFATARKLSTTADRDEWDTQYAHQIPIDWLSVYRVYTDVSCSDPSGWIKSEGWRREGQLVLAYDATVYLWGMKRVTDTGAFTSLFTQALAARIAADAAIPFTENATLQATMWQLYQAKLADAAVRDGQQGSNERFRSSSLVDVRGR
jgi:hypothetical protein